MNLDNVRRKVNQLSADRVLAAKMVSQEREALDKAKLDVLNSVQAQTVIQEAARSLQEKVHNKISGIVTHCLKSVFADEQYIFRIKFVSKRGKTDAVLVLEKDGIELDNPLEECGGGVIDVASLALRLACLMLSKPRGRKLLVLDEPMRSINGEKNRQRARDLFVSLSRDFNCQIILATGLSYLKGIGKEIEFGETE